MTKITISTPLRRYSGNAGILAGEGDTVLEVLKDASKEFPELRKKLFKTESTLSAQIIIYKENQDIRLLQKENTPMDSRSELKLIVALCGG